MTNRTINLTGSIYRYLLNNTLREHPVLQELRKITMQLPGSQMQIAPEQGQFMALLITLLGARKTLELGVYTGYSTLAVALALPQNGKIIACDISEEYPAVAKQFWQQANVAEKIDLRIAPALHTLDQLIATGEMDSFDFIFIDADKKNYPHYYEKSLTLLRPGGLLMIDNVLWHGDVADPTINDVSTKTIRHLNETILHDERVDMSLLPIGDGVMLVRKRAH